MKSSVKLSIERCAELRSIGLMRKTDICNLLDVEKGKLLEIIRRIEIIPFEGRWYDKYQIELIKEKL
jgi:hypothetical protein